MVKGAQVFKPRLKRNINNIRVAALKQSARVRNAYIIKVNTQRLPRRRFKKSANVLAAFSGAFNYGTRFLREDLAGG